RGREHDAAKERKAADDTVGDRWHDHERRLVGNDSGDGRDRGHTNGTAVHHGGVVVAARRTACPPWRLDSRARLSSVVHSDASARLPLGRAAPVTSPTNWWTTGSNQSGCAEPSDIAGGHGQRSWRPLRVSTRGSSSRSRRPSVPISSARLSRLLAAHVSRIPAA